jgi:hypothetical protein
MVPIVLIIPAERRYLNVKFIYFLSEKTRDNLLMFTNKGEGPIVLPSTATHSQL